MEAITNKIAIVKTEYRPCYVDGKKALFHRWIDREGLYLHFKCFISLEEQLKAQKTFYDDHIIPTGCDIERIKQTFAIVEFENGTVAEVAPCSIKFDDTKTKEYAFTLNE